MACSPFSVFGLTAIVLLCCSIALADLPPFDNDVQYMQGYYGNYTRQSYLSDREVLGPVANILVSPRQGLSPSRHVLWAPVSPYHPGTHPMILDSRQLYPVWYGPAHSFATMGPSVQTCNNTDYIMWWAGRKVHNWMQGRVFVYDSRYQLAYNITRGGDVNIPCAHEVYLTEQCSAIVISGRPKRYDLSAYNISDGWLLDRYFQEIDLASGQVLFEWQASAKINVTAETMWAPQTLHQGKTNGSGFDWMHLNSVQKDKKGNYLLSARHTKSIYYISGRTGDVLWRLGGRNSSFHDPSGQATDFAWQHMARWVDDDLTTLSLFDDRSTPYASERDRTPRGIIIKLDFNTMTAKLVHEYRSTHNIASVREGSVQVLRDTPGNVLVGYGNEPVWTEYSQSGEVLFEATLGPFHRNRYSADNYRTTMTNWTGHPTWQPKIAPGPTPEYEFDVKRSMFQHRLQDENGLIRPNDTAYFSWNGATEVKSWVVLASNATADLNVPQHFWRQVVKNGFETSCFVGAGTKYVVALAIDANNRVLGFTNTVDMTDFATIDSPDTDLDLEILSIAWQNHEDAQRSILTRLRGIASSSEATTLAFACGLLSVVAVVIAGCCLRCRSRRARHLYTGGDFDEFTDEDDVLLAGAPTSRSSTAFDYDGTEKPFDGSTPDDDLRITL